MNASLEDIVRLVELQLGKRNVRPENRIIEDLGAESMDIVNIVAAVEDRYAVGIEEREIPAVRTVADLYGLLLRKGR